MRNHPLRRVLLALAIATVMPGAVAGLFLLLNVTTPLSIVPWLQGTDLLGYAVLIGLSILAGYLASFFVNLRLLQSWRLALMLTLLPTLALLPAKLRKHQSDEREGTELKSSLARRNESLQKSVEIESVKPVFACPLLSGRPGFERVTLVVGALVQEPGTYEIALSYRSPSNPRAPRKLWKSRRDLAGGRVDIEFPLTFGALWGVFRKEGESHVDVEIRRKVSARELYGDRDVSTLTRLAPGAVSDARSWRSVGSRSFDLPGISNVETRAMGRLRCPE